MVVGGGGNGRATGCGDLKGLGHEMFGTLLTSMNGWISA